MSDPSHVVRRAAEPDLDALAAMGDALARQHHGFDPLRFVYPDGFESGYRWWFSQQLSRDGVYVAVIDGPAGPIGYVYGQLEAMDWNALLDAHAALVDVFVQPDARGTGAAAALVGAFVAWADAQGAPRVVLSAAARNVGAQRFFTKLGFRPTMIEMTRERG